MVEKGKSLKPKIRLMTEDDIDQVIQLDREITGLHRSITFSDPVNDYLGGEMGTSYVAESKDKVVGFLMGGLTSIGPSVPNIGLPNVGLIQLIGVSPAWRKKGVAKTLVEAFIKKCKEQKANSVHMLLLAQDKQMRSLFESCDFRGGEVIDMERKL